MSHHGHHGEHDSLFEQRGSFFLSPSQSARGALCFVLAGLISLGLGFSGETPERVWGAVIFNTFFFFSLALGGSAFLPCKI